MFSCLDTSIVSTALVSVSVEYQNFQDIPWVVLGYLLTYMSEHTRLMGREEGPAKNIPRGSIADFFFCFVFICRFGRRFLQVERHLRSQEYLGRRLADVHLGIGVVWCCAAHGGAVRLRPRPRPLRLQCCSLLTKLPFYSIAGRAVQGMGGSGLYSLAQVCLLEQGPSRPEIVGALVGVTLSVSFLLGPLFGGAISDWNWRGIFWFKLVLLFSIHRLEH